MQAAIIAIGDELLIGQVVDTNSAFIASQLNLAGITLHQTTCVHDSREHILSAVHQALQTCDIVLTTGGLGPTKDDITKHVLCDYFHTTLVEDPTVHAHVLELYKDRPDVLNALTATQWLVPASATILPNRVGSAPLMVFEQKVNGTTHYLCCMPGVPHEMQIALTEQILPFITNRALCIVNRAPKNNRALCIVNPAPNKCIVHCEPCTEKVNPAPKNNRASCIVNRAPNILHRTIQLYGIPESKLALTIAPWEDSLPPTMHLAYLPKDGIVRLRLSSYGEATPEEVEAQLQSLYPLVQPWLVATEDLPLETLVGNRLRALGATISTAESCTGGRLASLLTAQPGSSAFYYGSVISYDNSVKEKLLAVHHRDLETYGAVSEQVVTQMASAVRCLLHTDYAIATSGIAGPDGGTPDKPVGTVWIAWATPQGTTAQCFHFGVGEREHIMARACTAALVHFLRIVKD